MLTGIRFVISVPPSTSINNVSLDECLFHESWQCPEQCTKLALHNQHSLKIEHAGFYIF